MKYLNSIISVALMCWSLWQFFHMDNTTDAMAFLLTLAGGIIFFAFYIIETRNEEISKLRRIIMNKSLTVKTNLQ